MDHYARAYRVYSGVKGMEDLAKMSYSLEAYEQSEPAQKRFKILEFYKRYGEKATKAAFGVGRKTLYHWQKRLKDNGGRLEALVPMTKRPKRSRKSQINSKIIKHIQDLRIQHPRLGKEKIKPLLDEYCQKQVLKSISVSSIANVIKRYKLDVPKLGKIYHGTGHKLRRIKRHRVRYVVKTDQPGYILSDTSQMIVDGVKYYWMSAIDAHTKFALTLSYKRQNSRSMKDFYQRFKNVYPGTIRIWQTDNGSENLGEFEDVLKKDAIPQRFIYPHCPKTNAYIERYNRTLKEEFVYNHLDIIHDPTLWAKALTNWLIFYNFKRVHKSLNNHTPIHRFLQFNQLSHMYLTHTSL